MKRTLIALIWLTCICMTVLATNITGSWNGKLVVGPQSLTIVLNISDNGCTLDSPDQSVKGIQCETKHLSSDSISVNIPAIGASYAAKLTNGKLSGQFTQMGISFPLELQPGEVVIERPQTPRPPFDYETREVTFASNDATLSGTITIPHNHNNSTPIVLMVTGSGLQNRDEEVFGHRPFAVIADYLAHNGIASLRYDDRGYGNSTGNASQATTADFGNDAAAGIKYLKELNQFGKIGILGHSEGGLIAFRLAASGDVDFAIALASPAMRGDSLMLAQNESLLRLNGMPQPLIDSYINALAAIFNQRTNPSHHITNAMAFADSVVTAQGGKLPHTAIENLAAVLEEKNTWIDYFLTYSPRADIATVQCPVMAIGGNKDMQVPPTNIEIIKSLLPADKRNLVKTYDGLNHLFQHCNTGSPMEYNAITETFAPEVMQEITRWIKTQTAKNSVD
mgnify:FL=1